MRTTLTLEDEVAVALKDAVRRKGSSFKAEVNATLRAGLASLASPPKPKCYRLVPKAMGPAAPAVQLTKALELADFLEDEEIVRKLDLRK